MPLQWKNVALLSTARPCAGICLSWYVSLCWQLATVQNSPRLTLHVWWCWVLQIHDASKT